MKNYCEKHHLAFNGLRCPCCEKDRINNMVERFGKYVPKIETTKTVGNYSKESAKKYENPNLSWEDLSEKFNIIKSK